MPRRSSPKTISPYRPHGWQSEALRDLSPTMLATGGAGGGKSLCFAEKLHAYCMRYPGTMALMARKTRQSCSNSIVLLMKNRVIGADPRVRFLPSYFRFEYSNGSMLVWGGMKDEEQREAIRSIGQDGALDIAWLEEAVHFTEEDYNELSVRMRGGAAPWQQIMLSTNPGPPTHWIYRRLIKAGEASVYYSNAAENPYLSPQYHARLKLLTGIQKLRLLEGKWVLAEGVVYADYDPEIHLLHEWPGEFPRYIAGMDFGFANPGVFQVWGVDGDWRMTLLVEVYMTGKVIGWWVEQARRLRERFPFDVIACDPSAPAYISQLISANLPAVPAINDLQPGLTAVRDRLKVQEDGRPRIQFYFDALEQEDPGLIDLILGRATRPISTLEEIVAYRYPKPKEGATLKEDPVNENDHGMAAMRYAAMQLAYTGVGVW